MEKIAIPEVKLKPTLLALDFFDLERGKQEFIAQHIIAGGITTIRETKATLMQMTDKSSDYEEGGSETTEYRLHNLSNLI